MAQIPDFTAVGAAVPTPSYRRVPVDESGRILEGGAEALGRGLEQAANEDYTRNVQLARGEMDNAVLDHQIGVRTAVENVRDQVESGQLSWDQAGQAYQDAIGKLQVPQIRNLDPVGQETFQRGVARNVQGGAQAILGIARAGRKQAFQDQFSGALEKLDKLAGMPGANIDGINASVDSYRQMGMDAGIPAPALDKAIQGFKDRNWQNQATQRWMEAKDDPQALEQLRHDLTDADGFYVGKLNTERRDLVLGRVISSQLVLQNRLEHEQDKREAKAQHAMYQIDEQISSGIPATPAMWEQWDSLTRGTSFAQDFQDRQKDETQVQEVLRKPIAEQFKYVEDKESQLETEGGSMRDRANVLRLKTAVTQNANLMQNNPLIFAANRNGTEVAPIDLSAAGSGEGKQQVAEAIGDRMSTITALRKQYGPQIGVQPLLPQETAALHAQLDGATPAGRAQLLTSLRDTFNNDDAYQAVMRRIAPGSPVTAIAGQMIGASAPASTPAWYDRSYAPRLSDVEHVLNGEALLNPASAGKEAAAGEERGKGAIKGMPMPPEAQLRVSFGQAASGLFRDRPQLADAYYSVFKDAYASLLSDKGDMRGVGDSRLEQQALKIALGTRVDFNGNTVAAPAGMDPTRFQGLVRTAVSDAASRMKASEKYLDGLRGYQLRELGGLGSGVYELTNGNLPVLAPGGGGPFVIDLHKQYLPGTAGAAASRNVTSGEGLDLENKVAVSEAAAAQGAAQTVQ